MSLDIGFKLQERYEIVRFIKSGGMGSVCEARDLSLANSPCAIKEILESGANRDDADYIRSTFEKEMRALVALDHPCIPKVRDFFVDGDKRYIVMDYLGGNTLEEEIRQHEDSTGRGIPAGKAVSDILALLDIVIYLHGRSPALVHRDIKPSNIIREDKTGRLKLVDFGLARVVDNLSMQTMVGTWGFCAPEQLAGKAEASSDLYSVGCTLHHMLTGVAPRLSFEPLELHIPGLRPGLSEILTRATQPRPSERYTTAQEMAQDLKDWLDRSEGKMVRRAPRIAPKVRASSESSWGWATVVAMALTMGLLGGRVLTPPAPIPSPTFIVASLPAPTPIFLAQKDPVPGKTWQPSSPRAAALEKARRAAAPTMPRLDEKDDIPRARPHVRKQVAAVPSTPQVTAPNPKPVVRELPRLEEQPAYPQHLGVAPAPAPAAPEQAPLISPGDKGQMSGTPSRAPQATGGTEGMANQAPAAAPVRTPPNLASTSPSPAQAPAQTARGPESPQPQRAEGGSPGGGAGTQHGGPSGGFPGGGGYPGGGPGGPGGGGGRR